MLDESEFLSEHGIRSCVHILLSLDGFRNSNMSYSLSKLHKEHPWGMDVNGQRHEVNYWPGESHSGMFGGNSNWRGPICAYLVSLYFNVFHMLTSNVVGLAVNFLLIESLQRFHQYYGDEVVVECPTGSGEYMNLVSVAEEIQHRIIHIFGRDVHGRRALNGGNQRLDFDPHFRDYVWFYEVCPNFFCIRFAGVLNRFQYFHGDDGRGLGASHQTGW